MLVCKIPLEMMDFSKVHFGKLFIGVILHVGVSLDLRGNTSGDSKCSAVHPNLMELFMALSVTNLIFKKKYCNFAKFV